MAQIDILYGEHFEPLIKAGDFVMSEATEQNTAHLIVGEKGEFRHNPLAGVGLGTFLEGAFDKERLYVEIQTQIELDGKKHTQSEIRQIVDVVELLVESEK